MKKLNILLLFGGLSEEHPVSIMSAASVIREIDRRKYNVIPVLIDRQGIWWDPEVSFEVLEKGQSRHEGQEVFLSRVDGQCCLTFINCSNNPVSLDLLFPMLHGPFGEDGTIQGMCELLGLPYVGAGVLASALGMDKGYMKDYFAYRKLPQTNYVIIDQLMWSSDYDEIVDRVTGELGFPCFVKPANLGSSLGISKVKNSSQLVVAVEEAFVFSPRVLVERYVAGRELECSVLGNNEPKVAGPGEILYRREFYDYRAKYSEGEAELVIPASVDRRIQTKARALSLQAYKAIGCRGMARVDLFYCNDEQILVNEINTIPGFTPYSMYPRLWQSEGVPYPQLIDTIIDLALESKKSS